MKHQWRWLDLIRIVYIFAVLASGVWPAYASATYYVNASRPDDSGGGTSWASAKQTIQAAVDLALVAGDLVLVTNGVYDKGGKAETAGSTLTNRVYSSVAITIRAMSANPADTVIVGAPDPDTGGCGPAAIRGYKGLSGGAGSYLVGFTITNGYTFASGGTDWKDQYAGGAWGGALSNCDIVGNTAKITGGGRSYGPTYNSTIRNNTAASGGGAGISAHCYNCVISSNTAATGGGIYNGVEAYNCEIVNNTAGVGGALCTLCIASNCVIRGNTATNYGSVAGYSQAALHKFYNCLIAENVAPYGTIYQRYVVGSEGSRGVLINCTVVSNRVTTSGNCAGLVGQGGGIGIYSVTNCIIRFNYNTADGVETNYRFTANSTVAKSCLWPDVAGQLYDGGGNTSADPVLVGTGDYQTGYQLQTHSPCINAGTNVFWNAYSKDLRGLRRLRDGIVDMGAYEIIYNGIIVKGY